MLSLETRPGVIHASEVEPLIIDFGVRSAARQSLRPG